MKKVLFFIFIYFSTALFAEDLFDTFIDQQIKVETQLLDANLSFDKKVEIVEQQVKDYKTFFFQYAAGKELHLKTENPNRMLVNHLKLRFKSNKQQGFETAAMRDEIFLKNYRLRQGLRSALHDVLRSAEEHSKEYFVEELNKKIRTDLANYEPIDKKKYQPTIESSDSKLTRALSKALDDLDVMERVSYTFTSEAIENIPLIYTTAHFSKSKLFILANNINISDYGKKLNPYLSTVNLDLAKVVLLFLLILFVFIFQFVVTYVIDKILRLYKIKEEDHDYIQNRITKVFKYLLILFSVHLILVTYLGFNNNSPLLNHLFSITYVIIIALLLYRITNTIAYIKIESMQNNKHIKNEVINLSLKVMNAMIILIAFIAILKILGVNLTALLSGLGIAGAAVAFAAKDSISNIFGSISILLGDVFKQGDWIENKEFSGNVVEIGLRASTIRTFDNALISIPNSELANHGIKNWSRRTIGRRIKMDIGVTYQSNMADIKQALIDIREMLKVHPGVANENTKYQNPYRQAKLVSSEDFKGVKRKTLVYMDSYGASSINILVYCFSRTVNWAEWLEVKEDVMFKIAEILESNHLEFAYPTLTLHQAEKEEEKPQNKGYLER